MNSRLAELIRTLQELFQELEKDLPKDEAEYKEIFEILRDLSTVLEPRADAVQRICCSVRCSPLRLWIRYL